MIQWRGALRAHIHSFVYGADESVKCGRWWHKRAYGIPCNSTYIERAAQILVVRNGRVNGRTPEWLNTTPLIYRNASTSSVCGPSLFGLEYEMKREKQKLKQKQQPSMNDNNYYLFMFKKSSKRQILLFDRVKCIQFICWENTRRAKQPVHIRTATATWKEMKIILHSVDFPTRDPFVNQMKNRFVFCLFLLSLLAQYIDANRCEN